MSLREKKKRKMIIIVATQCNNSIKELLTVLDSVTEFIP